MVGVPAVLAAGCGSVVSGSGSAAGSVATSGPASTVASAAASSGSAPGSVAAPTTTAGHGASGGTGGTGTGTGGGGASGSAPRIDQFAMACAAQGTEDIPGLGTVPNDYEPVLTWHVTNATGVALSVDAPNMVGSYGTFQTAAGTKVIGAGGCEKGQGTHTFTLYTVGGTGPRAQRTLQLTGTHTEPTAPPYAYPSPTT